MEGHGHPPTWALPLSLVRAPSRFISNDEIVSLFLFAEDVRSLYPLANMWIVLKIEILERHFDR